MTLGLPEDDPATSAPSVSGRATRPDGYLGNSPLRVRVYNDKEMKEDVLLFDKDGQLDRGDVFEIFASTVGEDKLKSDISFFVDGRKETLHTSCSRPLGPGVRTSDGTFVVTDGRDRTGLRLCPGGGGGGQNTPVPRCILLGRVRIGTRKLRVRCSSTATRGNCRQGRR
jgi:hypothetical protein